jgi:hypothetical protein
MPSGNRVGWDGQRRDYPLSDRASAAFIQFWKSWQANMESKLTPEPEVRPNAKKQ